MQGITKGRNGANYIFWLSELQPTVQETSDNRDRGPNSGGPIELDNVRFSYPLRPDAVVLKGVDLEVRPLRIGCLCSKLLTNFPDQKGTVCGRRRLVWLR